METSPGNVNSAFGKDHDIIMNSDLLAGLDILRYSYINEGHNAALGCSAGLCFRALTVLSIISVTMYVYTVLMVYFDFRCEAGCKNTSYIFKLTNIDI